jgi:hypothetical protein
MAVMAEQLKVAELRDDSTTASSPRLAGALVLTDFAKTSSNRYSELGFGDFHFGMSPEEVTRHPSVKGPLVTGDELGGFVRDLAKHCFYFDKNQLRAIGKDYEGDMTGYFDELSRLFGKPERDGVFTVVGRDSINKTSHARVDVYYFFPHTISCISAMAGKSRSGVQYLNEPYRTTTSSFELVTVRIVDKDWLLPQAEAYANNLGAILIWINENAAPIQLQKVSTLPDFPKAKRTFSPLGEANVHKSNTRGGLSEVVYYDAEGNTFLSVEHFDYKGERASGMPESGSVKIDLDSAKLPSGQHEIVSCGVLQHLRCRLNTRVVQSVFPSNDGKVYQGQSQNGFEFYKWTDKYDITIEVSTNMITLRHGRAKL